MKVQYMVPSIFLGGPVGLVLAGLLGSVLSAPAALGVGAAVSVLVGSLVLRGVRRPIV